MAKNPTAPRTAPASGGAIPEEAEDLTKPALTQAEIERRWSEAGDEARAAEAKEKGTGEAVFRASLAREPAVPLPPRDEVDPRTVPPSNGKPAMKPAPEPPAGYALFANPTDTLVTVTLREGDNRPRTTRIKSLDYGVFPIEYIDVVKNHAPQLTLVSQRAVERDEG